MQQPSEHHGEQGHGQRPEQMDMGGRGVTRPQMPQHQQEPPEHAPAAEQDQDGQQTGHHMSHAQRMELLTMHHRQTLWVYWTLILLGVWTLLAPLSFSYGVGVVTPAGGREVWLALPARIMALTWSDMISGLLLIIFGWRALTPNRPRSLWICCGVGIWLSLAPLIFWAPNAAAYLNATLVGALVIALSVLIPGMPNMLMYMRMGQPSPAGWSYNPSSWPQRSIMIALGFAGWLVSRYLASYQLGYIDQVWDPFFDEGSRLVLNSNVSHMWPVSDAALGAFAYTLEFLMGWMGSPARWRTMPWMVTFFGILVIPLGLVHIFLVISQPVMVGQWCTLCLLAAAIMLPMIPLEVDEVVAMGQHLVQSRRRGTSLWQTFWKGGPAMDSQPDERTPDMLSLPAQPGALLKASIWGMSFPWTLLLSALLGIWLMFAPTVFGLQGLAADAYHLGGALIVVVAVIAMGEVVRAARYLNLLLGAGVAAVPWLLGGPSTLGLLNGLIVGALVALLALPRGPKQERYGLWDRFVV